LGTLPPGLSLAPATGIISGKPTAATISNFTIEVQDSAGTPQTATAGLSISVSPAALTITTSSLSSGKVGKTYSQTLKASGGVAPYAWSVSSGKLPAGLSLAATTGIISGKPSLAATSSFTIGVHDSQSTPFSVRRGYQLRISK